MNLPNKITLARIFMIPLFVVIFYLRSLSSSFIFPSSLITI